MNKSAANELFRTPVSVPPPLRPLSVGDGSVLLGSCFAEHVGRRMADAQLSVTVNPLGVLYNPLSIVRVLKRAVADAPFTRPADYVRHGEMWHSWLGDSTLSAPTQEMCRRQTEEALTQLHGALAEADNLFLTLGTSRCYLYKGTRACVANCHRIPGGEFDETEPEVDEIVEQLDEALTALHGLNSRLQVVFTVSPYRYAKYGMHESQLAKARLLLAAESLRQRHPDRVSYFPAYEIVMDELRDYRFYASDMLHPAEQAVDYIWRRLCEAWADDALQTYLARWEPVRRALLHRPINPRDPATEAFRQRTREQLDALRRDYPMLRILPHGEPAHTFNLHNS